MDWSNGHLIVTLQGISIDTHQLNAYELGKTLINMQRIIGTSASYELSRTGTPFNKLRGPFASKPPLSKLSPIQIKFSLFREGSLEIHLGLVLAAELYRNTLKNPEAKDFIVSVLANLFSSTLLYVGKKFVTPIKKAKRPVSYNEFEKKDLAFRLLPYFTEMATKINSKSGISQFDISYKETEEEVEWNLSINHQNKGQIISYADEVVSPISTFKGYLGEISLFNKTGKLKLEYDDEVYELAVPDQSMCEDMAKYLNKKIVVLGNLQLHRKIESRHLRKLLVVHNFEGTRDGRS